MIWVGCLWSSFMIKCSSATVVLFVVTFYLNVQIGRISLQIIQFYQRRRLWIQRGRVVKAPDLKSRSDHELELFHVVSGSTLRLRLYIANWSASCQLGFLTCSVYRSRLFQWPWKAPARKVNIFTFYLTFCALSFSSVWGKTREDCIWWGFVILRIVHS